MRLALLALGVTLACGYIPTVMRVGSAPVITMGTEKQSRILKKVRRAAKRQKELKAPETAAASYPEVDVSGAAEDIAATLADEPAAGKSRIKSFFTKTYDEPKEIEAEPIDDAEPIDAEPIDAEPIDAETKLADSPTAEVESILADVTSKAKEVDVIEGLAKIIVGAEKAVNIISEADVVKNLGNADLKQKVPELTTKAKNTVVAAREFEAENEIGIKTRAVIELALDAARPFLDAGVEAAKKAATPKTKPAATPKRPAMKGKKQAPKAKGVTFEMPKFEMPKFKK